MYHLLTQLPLKVEERNNLVIYSRSFLPVWYRAGVACTECLLIFDTYLVGFILSSYIFHRLNIFGNYKSKQSLGIHQFILELLHGQKDSINRMNNGQANH